MSANLSSTEASEQSSVPSEEFEVTLTFKISPKAVDTYMLPGASLREFQSSALKVLIVGLHSEFLRLQAQWQAEPKDDHVPGKRRQENLSASQRMLSLALTNLEQAALWATKAVRRAGS